MSYGYAIRPISLWLNGTEVSSASIQFHAARSGNVYPVGVIRIPVTANSESFRHGDPASVYVGYGPSVEKFPDGSSRTFEGGYGLLLDGYIDDAYPAEAGISSDRGVLANEVRVCGRLALLAQATSAGAASGGLELDMNVPCNLALADGDVNADVEDFWVALRDCIAYTVTTVRPLFAGYALEGSANAGQGFGVLDILYSIQGSLVWGAVSKNTRVGICETVSSIVKTNWNFSNVLQLISEIGAQMGFTVFESGRDIVVAPFTPMFISTSARRFSGGLASRVTRNFSGDVRRYFRGALLTSPPQQNVDGGGIVQRQVEAGVVGAFITDSLRGQVLIAPAPNILVSASEALLDFSLDEARDLGQLREQDSVGRAYARDIALTTSFENSVIKVTSPDFLTQVGLLTPIRLFYGPDVPDEVVVRTTYGLVTGVTYNLDASSGVCQTEITINYARSHTLQETINGFMSPPHPLFSNFYMGGTIGAPDQ